MPFAASFAVVWDILRKPLETAGYVVRRADTDPSHGNVLRDIVGRIADADLIVADMTGNNPNVFYELGLSHGLRTPTILVAQSIDDIPFDLRSYHVERYGTDYAAAQDFQQRLEDVARRAAAGDLQPGSPVIDHLPEVVTSGRPRRAGTPQQQQARLSALQTLVYALVEPIRRVLGRLGDLLGDWQGNQEALEGIATRIEALNAEPGEASSAAVQQLAADAAARVQAWTERMAADVPGLTQATRQVTELASGLPVALAVDYDEATRDLLTSVYWGLDHAHQAATGAVQSAALFRELLLRLKNRRPELDFAVERAAAEVDAFTSAALMLQAFALNGSNLLRDHLGEVGPPAPPPDAPEGG